MGGKVVIHPNTSNAELENERREAYLRLSLAERVQETLKMYRMSLLFSQEKIEKRKCVRIKQQ